METVKKSDIEALISLYESEATSFDKEVNDNPNLPPSFRLTNRVQAERLRIVIKDLKRVVNWSVE
jgi:hypothetical protein